MKKEKKKAHKLDVKVNLKKAEKYHFIPELSNVFFPYQPYPQQLDIVKCIQSAISNKQNALIQSPTGTGKTLCLIIGSLSSLVDLECRKKVYYLTRTHSQISQVINQFKKTVYECNLNIIASREQFCLNYNISQLKGKQLQKACDELCIQKLCPFKQHSYNKIPPPMEVHQLRDYCKKQLVCPYYYSKQLTQRCQITILPFNYLLDWSLFQKNSMDLKDSIIIFDQAHNIDSLCQQGSDIRLNFDILYQGISQLKTLIKLQSKRYLHKQFRQSQEQFKQAESIKQQMQYFLNSMKKSQQILFLRRQDFLQKMQYFTNSSKQQGLDLGNYTYFCSKSRKVIKLFHKKEQVCENFRILIDTIEKIFTICNNLQQFSKFTVNLTKGQLLLRCLDPSICFKRLIDCKPRSVILSSGTMGNLQLWQKNLQVKFRQKMATQSFITSNHLFATVRSKTQSGTPYNFSFQGKQSEKQFEQMCFELSKLQQIVQGGIVVAFSNYDLLEKSLKYASILKKKVFFETKGGNVDEIIKQFASQVKERGAFMFIIIKGRFSQGINFSDNLCRCLVVIGIPFLPLKNVGIVQKMKYLEQNYTKADSELWYTEQSFKSLNQTIGRAIRNSKDYAAIILMDQRYSKQENLKYLSKWFSKCIKQPKDLFKEIQAFYKLATSSILQSQTKKKQDDTKNKHESSIKDRLKQFSTPSKTNKKRLKIILQSEEKTSILPPTILKQIKIQEQQQTAYKSMDKQLANYFLNQQIGFVQSQECSQTKIFEIEANENIRKLNLIPKSNRKCHDIIDF